MAADLPRSFQTELILGGQKSGKSRRAEERARRWLDEGPVRRVVLIATALGADAEMQARIARHRADRAAWLPEAQTVEEPLALARALRQHSRADTLVVVDCLTLWLTNLLMPAPADAQPQTGPDRGGAEPQGSEKNGALALGSHEEIAMLIEALGQSPGPVVLVSNEIGLGVIPLGAQVRAFVDALGLLNQSLARVCPRVTLMSAGLPLALKGDGP